MQLEEAKRRGAAAYERRFGQSLMPLCMLTPAPGVLVVLDPETRSLIEVDYTGWRIRVVAEYDAMSDETKGA